MLIENNIIGFKGIIINIINKQARIKSYKKIIIKINAKLRGEFIRRKVYIKNFTLMSLKS